MEIYNENITDLLASRESRGKSLSVREDISGNVYVADLKEECVNCEESVSVDAFFFFGGLIITFNSNIRLL